MSAPVSVAADLAVLPGAPAPAPTAEGETSSAFAGVLTGVLDQPASGTPKAPVQKLLGALGALPGPLPPGPAPLPGAPVVTGAPVGSAGAVGRGGEDGGPIEADPDDAALLTPAPHGGARTPARPTASDPATGSVSEEAVDPGLDPALAALLAVVSPAAVPPAAVPLAVAPAATGTHPAAAPAEPSAGAASGAIGGVSGAALPIAGARAGEPEAARLRAGAPSLAGADRSPRAGSHDDPAGSAAPTPPGPAAQAANAPFSVNPAAAPAAAPAEPRAIPDTQPALGTALARLRHKGDGTSELSVSLHPAELGSVGVTATVRDGMLTVTVACADRAAHDAVTAALPALRHDLAAAGFTGIDVALGDRGPQPDPRAPQTAGQYAATSRDGDTPDARPRTPSRPPTTDRGLDRWL